MHTAFSVIQLSRDVLKFAFIGAYLESTHFTVGFLLLSRCLLKQLTIKYQKPIALFQFPISPP